MPSRSSRPIFESWARLLRDDERSTREVDGIEVMMGIGEDVVYMGGRKLPRCTATTARGTRCKRSADHDASGERVCDNWGYYEAATTPAVLCGQQGTPAPPKGYVGAISKRLSPVKGSGD